MRFVTVPACSRTVWPSRAGLIPAAFLIAGLAGCTTPESPSTGLGSAPAAYAAEDFVGRWGLASYHRDTDRVRTETLARQQCGNPYVIKRGPNGGLMMHVADDPELRELQLKGSTGGQTFIGPDGPPGDTFDREVTAFDGKILTTRWVDPEVAARYGTMVLVRCGTA